MENILTPLTIMASKLPSGKVGTSYSQPVPYSGGTPGYTWAVTVGALPAGLTLDPTTGVISGIPTTPVVVTQPTFTVTDSSNPAQTAIGRLTLTITN